MDTLIIDAKVRNIRSRKRGKGSEPVTVKSNEKYEKHTVWQTHRHTPEIEEQLGYASGKEVVINFTPHLVPMNRGILANRVREAYKGCYLGRSKSSLR